MIKLIKINGKRVWLYIDQLRIFTKETNELVQNEEYLCYFKYSEPTPFILGELIRENDLPKIFPTVDEAIGFSETYLKTII